MKYLILFIGLLSQSSSINGLTKYKQDVHVAPPPINPQRGGSGSSSSGDVIVPGAIDFEVHPPGGGGGTGTGINPPPGSLVKGLECGTSVQMYAGSIVQIFSNNFNLSNYNNYESCYWKFEANHCTLSAHCPCVEIPKSWECLGDYLRISSTFTTSQRFCGGNVPGQPIYSESDNLNIKFRSDGRITAAGFTCFVRCEGPGMTIPLMPIANCPSSLTARG